MFRLLDAEHRRRFQLVALSGTSGGAVCAALVWRGLVASGADEAAQRLSAFWRDIQVRDLMDAIGNLWAVWMARAPVTFEVSPYLYEPQAQPRLQELLRSHVIASAAVPPLFRAVPDDEGHLYWDGLFASNPPVREFTDLAERPDEIWVVQINPQHRDREPRSIREIVDRRNELAGNLSLGQELYFVDTINRLIDDHQALAAKYKRIGLRVVELAAEDLDYPSKLDRDGAFIEQLLDAGRERADWFFDARSEWPRERTAPARSVVRA